MTLILLVCMPVTEVYAGTSTKTYGTDAFGETNGYLRLSQGTIKSCKYSKMEHLQRLLQVISVT